MFTASADLYDLIYSTIKDYPAEAAHIARLLRGGNPDCRTILDAACGTGEHARLLAAQGFAVDGFDLAPDFVRIARAKNHTGRFFVADMSAFHVARQYDAVLCLFSSIGYLKTLDRVTKALRCFRDQLSPGGMMIVEPWFLPGVLDPNRVMTHRADGGGIAVSRTSHVEIVGNLSRVHFDYEITDGSGTRHVQEVHELGLFTTEELMHAFRDAGLEAEHDPKGLMDRGLFTAKVSSRRR